MYNTLVTAIKLFEPPKIYPPLLLEPPLLLIL